MKPINDRYIRISVYLSSPLTLFCAFPSSKRERLRDKQPRVAASGAQKRVNVCGAMLTFGSHLVIPAAILAQRIYSASPSL